MVIVWSGREWQRHDDNEGRQAASSAPCKTGRLASMRAGESSTTDVEDGSTVALWDKQWQARVEGGGGLRLTHTTSSSDLEEQLERKLRDRAHELEMRRAEMAALTADKDRLELLCEEVWPPCICRVAVRQRAHKSQPAAAAAMFV